MWAWWIALHAVLAAAALLAGAPLTAKALVLAALAGHSWLRRPRPGPATIAVAADASCEVPEWSTGRVRLGAKTLVCPLWIRLDLGPGPRRRYVLLVVDQVPADQWRRMRALLLRSHRDRAT